MQAVLRPVPELEARKTIIKNVMRALSEHQEAVCKEGHRCAKKNCQELSKIVKNCQEKHHLQRRMEMLALCGMN